MLEEGNSTTNDNFKATFLSSSNAVKFLIDLRGSMKTWDDPERMDQEPRWDDKEKIDHVTGTVTLTFEPIGRSFYGSSFFRIKSSWATQ